MIYRRMADMSSRLDDSFIVHPKLQNLLTFWDCRRGAHALPRRSAIPAEAFKPWMGHLMLVAPEGKPPRFRVRLHGTRLYGYHGRDLTGWYLDELVGEPALSRIVAPYVAAVRTGAPQYDVIASPFEAGTVHHLARLVLPCGEDGASVDQLIVGIYLQPEREESAASALSGHRAGTHAPAGA